MSEPTHVNFNSLSQGSESILALHRELQETLDSLEHELGPMVSTWTGEAREAYFQQKRKWDEASAAMAEILQRMGHAVQQAHDDYSATERTNRDLWS